ncbi:YbhB/YbcL family Raf kinase inhibitor-like protein [Azospirillum picis]|uniref:Raf kinase inhibitor-like YbhB/YbcL family protein n=1 Tax=Azospirillum picis TaxID=488438 RepID=A0ABU0MGQ3_9PROT|nr:YbhB/YbcL family Raf kinase inhibitor-like protein [Azospirillum picis]MBP2298542.1 Raf kinase inhibitor-like YbhB/YbcL family protein [Azospirillum picis]MDQ0532409.1 Raf kinase inhibitor-like YbhB/YbcL family protein [Azospirillum picis]
MTRYSRLLLTTLLVAAAAPAAAFDLHSPDFSETAPIPQENTLTGFGCSGGNRSPALAWSDPPEGTRSLAVTIYDPDAPTGSGWWHWVVFNLPADSRGLRAGAGDPTRPLLPAGATQSRTDFGTTGYGGPCPPRGDRPHRYIVTVHALAVDKLPLTADASGAMVGFNLHAATLATATLTARYGR